MREAECPDDNFHLFLAHSRLHKVPLRDILDVERRFKTVWIKCLHLGTVGFEATLEDDAVIFYLAMDSLLSKRCGVVEGEVCIPGPLIC